MPGDSMVLVTSSPSATSNASSSMNNNNGTNFTRKCSCFRTQCLKMYCECFSAKRKCEGCACVSCLNHDSTPEVAQVRNKAIQEVTLRNPNAFSAKIQQTTQNSKAVHSRGCNCRKSNCLKNYCECFEARVQCNPLCRCQNCYNCESHQHKNDSSMPALVSDQTASRVKEKKSKNLTKAKANFDRTIQNNPEKSVKRSDLSDSFKIENLTKFDDTSVAPNTEENSIITRTNINHKFLSQLSAMNLPLAALLMFQTHKNQQQQNQQQQVTYQKTTSPIIEISRNSSCSSMTNNHDEQSLDFQSSSTSSCITFNENSSSKRKKSKPVKLSSTEIISENSIKVDIANDKNIIPRSKTANCAHFITRKSRHKRLINENKNLHRIIKNLQIALKRKTLINRAVAYERNIKKSWA